MFVVAVVAVVAVVVVAVVIAVVVDLDVAVDDSNLVCCSFS